VKKNLRSVYDDVHVVYSGPPWGEQIGDHKGCKKVRNRHTRRAWKNGGRIMADRKYRGYD